MKLNYYVVSVTYGKGTGKSQFNHCVIQGFHHLWEALTVARKLNKVMPERERLVKDARVTFVTFGVRDYVWVDHFYNGTLDERYEEVGRAISDYLID